MEQAGLRRHPAKTRIVYGNDGQRRASHEHASFTFLGFTFRAREINPAVRGWIQHCGAFYRSALLPLLRGINACLMRWLRKKDKRLAPAKRAGACWKRGTTQYPRLFARCDWAPYSRRPG